MSSKRNADTTNHGLEGESWGKTYSFHFSFFLLSNLMLLLPIVWTYLETRQLERHWDKSQFHELQSRVQKTDSWSTGIKKNSAQMSLFLLQSVP
jgi:heme/copper-type cytochrome/quinol oxidase subunit 3